MEGQIADRLDAMRALVAVCELNGFSAAARRLSLSSSAVTRLVAALERSLGVQLLHRSTRSIRLTRAGAAYLPLARATLEQAAAAERAARCGDTVASMVVRVAAPLLFGRLHAARLLAAFMADHPDVRTELFLANDYARLIDEGVELAIRIGHLPDSGLITRSLGETRIILVASPDYLDSAGTPTTPEDLAGHRLIGSEGAAQRRLWRFVDDGASLTLAVEPVFFSDNAEAAITHAAASGGIASVLSYQVAAQLRTGELVEVLPALSPAPVPIQAVLPGTRFVDPIVRELIDLFAQESGQWA